MISSVGAGCADCLDLRMSAPSDGYKDAARAGAVSFRAVDAPRL
jgi:hypothetical protein